MEFVRGQNILASITPVKQMYKEFRAWTIISLLLGMVSIFPSSSFNPTWGILLVIVALLSWKARVPGLFAAYAVIMGWAAIMNFIAGFSSDTKWLLGLAGFQVIWTAILIQKARDYSRIDLQALYHSGQWPTGLREPSNEKAISGKLAIASVTLSAAAWIAVTIGLGILIMLGIMMAANHVVPVEPVPNSESVSDNGTLQVNYLCSGVADAAVFALAAGLAALVSRTQRRNLAIAGTVSSGLYLIIILVLAIVGNLV